MGNHVIHVEVTGKDGAKLQSFYQDVLGWSFDTNNPAATASPAGTASPPAWRGTGRRPRVRHVLRPRGRPEGRLAKAEADGGRVIMPLTEVAPETTIALFADPEGHVVGPGRHHPRLGHRPRRRRRKPPAGRLLRLQLGLRRHLAGLVQADAALNP